MTKRCPRCGLEADADERYCPRDGMVLVNQVEGDPWIGRVVEHRYRIDSLLGSGGMGIVYSAEHLRIGRQVAIKLVQVGDDTYASFKRLEREARSVALIGNDHIVDVLDFGCTDDGTGYLVMELLEGETLDQRLMRQGVFPLAECCTILTQVAYALQAAHGCGVIHRDIKPGNIFLAAARGRRDFVKVLDFGLAALRGQRSADATTDVKLSGNMVLGTPEYLAPEQAQAEGGIDARTDLFSLGVTMYEMLCGRPPFVGKGPIDTVVRVLEEEPVPVSQRVSDLPLGKRVDELLASLLSKDPVGRPPSARAVRRELVALRRAMKEPTRRREEQFETDTESEFGVWVSNRGERTTIEPAGVLDEQADLKSVTTRVASRQVDLKLRRVRRINSVGYQRWIEWLRQLIALGHRVSLHECPPVIVRQANMSPGFLQGLPVISFYAPYRCDACGYSRLVLLRGDSIDDGPLPSPGCDDCGQQLVFDEVEQTYFLFLRR